MSKKILKTKQGFTLLEVLVTLGIMVIGLLGITQMTILFLQINADQKAHVTAIALANEKIELLRNLPYRDIGTVGGVPAGNLEQEQTITRNGIDFNVKTEIIYIDDPFDGLITTTGNAGSIYNNSNSEVLYYWNMDSNTGGTAPSIGNGNLSFIGTTLVTGYQINGVSMTNGDRITTSASGNIDSTKGRIGVWYNPSLSNSDGERIIDISTDSGYLFIRRRDNETLQFSYGANSDSATSEALTWTTGQWYFIEAAWDTDYRQVWRDGIPLDLNESSTGLPVFQDQMNIGNRGDSSEILRGTLDELYILSEPHKYENWGYNKFNPYTPGNPQTTFYWNMDSGDTSQTPQLGSGTITVGGDYSTVSPAVKNGGLNLSDDGSNNDYAYIPGGSNIDFGHSRIAFWFQPRSSSVSAAGTDYLLTAASCSDGYLQLIRDNDESIAFNYGSSANHINIDSISLNWEQDWWYLMEVAMDDSEDSISVLVNGIEVASSNGTPIDAPVGCSGLYLANISSSSNNNGDGTFDEMYILNEPYPASSSATDTLNTDYKRAKITVSWTGNKSEKQIFLITDIAPPGIETTAGGGTLILNTIDASGIPVAEANIQITNDTIDPPVNLNLTSDSSGKLIIPGMPATSTSYQITVSKTGYSSDYTASATSTYTTPIRDHLSVLESQVTESSFIIDRVSTLNISTVSQTLPVNFKLNTDSSGEDQTDPSLALGSSYIYTTWRDYRDSSYFNYSQKYSYGGTSQWVNDTQSANQGSVNNPRIAIDSAENQYIVWSDNSDGDYDIYLQKLSSGGVVQFGSPIKINNDSDTSDQINPEIYFYNNDLYIVWQDGRNDGGDIYFNKTNTSGTVSFGSDIKINSDAGSNTQTNPKILIDSYGFVYVAWLDNRNGSVDIYLDKVTTSGTNEWGSEIEINSNAATNISSFDIAQNSDIETHVVWTDNRNSNYDIFFQSIASSSIPLFGSDQAVTTSSQSNNQESVRVDMTSSGDLMIGWQDDRSSDKDIYVLRVQDDGTNVWSNDVRFNLTTESDQLLSDIIVYDSDKVIAVWTDYSQGDADVWAGTLNYSGTETPVPFVDFTITGTKLTHQTPDKLKFEENYSTGAAGTLALTNLEWDTYTIVITEPGLSLTSSVPAIPISLDPNTSQDLKLIVD